MKILYSFPHAIGAPGIGTTAAHQALGLVQRGHDVTVMATSAHKSAPAFPRFISTLVFAGVRMPHRVLGMDRTMAYHDMRVARHLTRHPDAYDVVHCWPGATLDTARIAAKLGLPALREVPNTHTANAGEVVRRLCEELGVALPEGNSHKNSPEKIAREQAEYDAAFRLLVPSENVAKTFRERGFADDKLSRHRYGFDPAVFTPAAARDAGPLKAVFLGSIGPRKGLHVALEAWSRSQASKTGQFAIYGRIEDGYAPVIEPYLGVPGVSLHDFTSNVNQMLQSSDVLLLPSFEEGSALVTYEAQGCGVIPLVSDAAGAMCADGVTGLVHKAGDAAALTGHLDRLAGDADLRRAMRDNVLSQRDQLSWAAAAERLEACYEEARASLSAPAGPDRKPKSQAQTQADTTGVSAPRDLVFTFWQETWADAVKRSYMTPDRLAHALLERPEVGSLLVANPYRMGPSQVYRRLQGRRMPPLPRRPHPTAMASPLRLRRKDGTGQGELRRTYVAYDRSLHAASTELGLVRPPVLTMNPFYAAYGPADWCGPVTYFAFDDWAAYDDHARWWPDYIRAYDEIRRRGHRVCAVSQHLLDRINPTGPGLVVPNGIAPEEWRTPLPPPDWVAGLPRPLILYTGSIHSRLDLDAVRDVSKRYSHGTILFVGPVSNHDVAHKLTQIPGVQLRGSLPRTLVAGLTQSADACIMPHHRNPLTESMSPIKIYEYCAAGIPTAATDMASVRKIHKHIVLTQPGDSFADAVERAIAIGPMPEDQRQRFIDENSWAQRQEAILNLTFQDAP